MKIFSFSKTYGSLCVLKVPSLDLEPGKIYSIIGSNGSGKSTFAKILAGVLAADHQMKPFEYSVSIGYMPQKNYGFRMSTRKNILLGSSDSVRADYLMNALQIQNLADKRADRLSGGETARMALARLMMKQFDMVILDEPTASMDMETTFLSEKLIIEYVKDTGCTLILITHSLQQARRMADEVFYFHKGQLLEYGSKEILLYNPTQPETKQFLEFYGV